VGAPLQESPLVMLVLPQVTVGAVTEMPAVTFCGEGLPQVNFGLTFIVPQDAACVQDPVAFADTV